MHTPINGVSSTTPINQLSTNNDQSSPISKWRKKYQTLGNPQEDVVLPKQEGTPEPPTPTPDTVAAEEKAERDKESYFTQQAVSKRRVAQSEDGSWYPLTDPELSQEKTAYSGVIYDTSKGHRWRDTVRAFTVSMAGGC